MVAGWQLPTSWQRDGERRLRHPGGPRRTLVAGFAHEVLGNKVRDNRRSSLGLKAKHALFSGTVFRCDVLVATELFGPGLDDEGCPPPARGELQVDLPQSRPEKPAAAR